jgi:hypothetical protein
MVIEQIVDIPADHRIFLDVPPEVPAGKARIELKVTPVHEERNGAEANVEGQTAKSATPLTDRLAGTAAHLGDITLEQIREERLRKDAGEYTGESATPHLDALSGIAAHLGDITLEQIREERLSKKAEGLAAKSATPHADFLSGILASAGDITMKQIREERLVKRHLS